jgi:hypothetical protein
MKQLSPELQSQLEALRDIHLPSEAISWWPLAPGWWILIGVSAMLLCVSTFGLYLRRRTVRHAALKEVDALRQQFGKDPSNLLHLATDLSVLLHRITLKQNGAEIATQSGHEWAAFLSEGEKGMVPDLATFLTQAPYAAQVSDLDPSPTQLLDAVELWIRRHA